MSNSFISHLNRILIGTKDTKGSVTTVSDDNKLPVSLDEIQFSCLMYEVQKITKELRKMNLHLSQITDEKIRDDDVQEVV